MSSPRVVREDGSDLHGQASDALSKLGAWLLASFAAERDRWILWVPVAIGSGILLYFSLTLEPAWWAGAAGLVLTVMLAPPSRGQPAVLAVASIGALAAVGFLTAQLRTATVATPLIERRIGPTLVEGRVAGIDALDGGTRLILSDVQIQGLRPEATPVRVRVRLNGDAEPPAPGARIRVRAVLNPLPPPVSPGGFDFQRHAFFGRIGGTGFAIGPVSVLDPSPGGWAASLEQARQQIARQLKATLPRDEAAIAIALLTGEQTAIPKQVIEQMRDSGLAHLLSISGLHIGLVAGIILFAVRAALALFEGLALRRPIKKYAAVAAFFAAAGYTALVEAPVPTLRSLLMTGVVLFAILIDRNPISMRLVAFAATVVLLALPEAVLGPSFQMSFAAVAALIAGYEAIRLRWHEWRAGASWPVRFALYLAGVALTSIIASVATTPFSLFHFQQFQWYGLLANMVAVPVTAFWVMPWTIIVYLTIPFGLDAWPMQAMGWGITLILATAEAVAGLPGAVFRIPAMPVGGFAAIVIGGLWLVLWRGRWRMLGFIGIVAGLASVPLARHPDILVSADGKLVAARGADGTLAFLSDRAAKFSGQSWLRRDGQEVATTWPKQGATADGRLSCDALGCLYRVHNRQIAIIKDRQAISEDCGEASLVISLVAAGRRCPAPLVIDWFDLRREGAHAFYINPEGIEVETVRRWRGIRPWTGGHGGDG